MDVYRRRLFSVDNLLILFKNVYSVRMAMMAFLMACSTVFCGTTLWSLNFSGVLMLVLVNILVSVMVSVFCELSDSFHLSHHFCKMFMCVCVRLFATSALNEWA